MSWLYMEGRPQSTQNILGAKTGRLARILVGRTERMGVEWARRCLPGSASREGRLATCPTGPPNRTKPKSPLCLGTGAVVAARGHYQHSASSCASSPAPVCEPNADSRFYSSKAGWQPLLVSGLPLTAIWWRLTVIWW